jgi:hypothetical protein
MAVTLDPRIWLLNLLVRVDGPGAVRFIVQPLVAIALGIRDGLRDADAGRSPFLSATFRDVSRRKALIRDLATAVGKPFIVAIAIDAVVSYFVLGAIYPFSTLFVATVLIVVPYLVARELTVHVITLLRATHRQRLRRA